MEPQPPNTSPNLTPTNPPGAPTNPVPSQSPQTINADSDSKKTLIIVAVVAVLLAALVGGGYYYFTTMQNNSVPTPAQKPTSQKPSATAEPAPEDELNALTIDDGSADFATIDQDLQNL